MVFGIWTHNTNTKSQLWQLSVFQAPSCNALPMTTVTMATHSVLGSRTHKSTRSQNTKNPTSVYLWNCPAGFILDPSLAWCRCIFILFAFRWPGKCYSPFTDAGRRPVENPCPSHADHNVTVPELSDGGLRVLFMLLIWGFSVMFVFNCPKLCFFL